MAFRVPEPKRILDGPMGSPVKYGNSGAFLFESPESGWSLVVIADDGRHAVDDSDPWRDWEHVSVHASRGQLRVRTPVWKEMCFIKDQFWEPEDVVMQLHPRGSQVNDHPCLLHLWRHRTLPIPEPPPSLITGMLRLGLSR